MASIKPLADRVVVKPEEAEELGEAEAEDVSEEEAPSCAVCGDVVEEREQAVGAVRRRLVRLPVRLVVDLGVVATDLQRDVERGDAPAGGGVGGGLGLVELGLRHGVGLAQALETLECKLGQLHIGFRGAQLRLFNRGVELHHQLSRLRNPFLHSPSTPFLLPASMI